MVVATGQVDRPVYGTPLEGPDTTVIFALIYRVGAEDNTSWVRE
jgi:hypothetical protein